MITTDDFGGLENSLNDNLFGMVSNARRFIAVGANPWFGFAENWFCYYISCLYINDCRIESL